MHVGFLHCIVTPSLRHIVDSTILAVGWLQHVDVCRQDQAGPPTCAFGSTQFCKHQHCLPLLTVLHLMITSVTSAAKTGGLTQGDLVQWGTGISCCHDSVSCPQHGTSDLSEHIFRNKFDRYCHGTAINSHLSPANQTCESQHASTATGVKFKSLQRC